MKYSEVEANSLTEGFIQSIIEEILSGKLQTGQKLSSEREYSERFHISRTIVNAGLHRLEEMGFVTIVPRQGAFVKDLALDGNIEVLEAILQYTGTKFHSAFLDPLLDAREALEPVIVRKAAQARTEEQFEALVDIVDRLKASEDINERSALGREFAVCMARCSNNLIIPILCNSFATLYQTVCNLLLASGFDISQYTFWDSMLQAIRDKDEDRAVELDRSHIINGRKWIEAHYPTAIASD